MIGRIAMAALVACGALLARDANALPRAADLRAAAESLGSVETVQEARRPRRGSLGNRGITAGPESGGPLRYSPGLHGNQ